MIKLKDLITEATATTEWTKDELTLIKRTKVKVDGKMYKFKITKAGGEKKVARFEDKQKENPSYGRIEKYHLKGKTSYTGFFAGWVGQGMGWKSSDVKESKEFDEEQNLKLLAKMFKKLQTIINRVW
jgi:outer membrane cobalamin receptor